LPLISSQHSSAGSQKSGRWGIPCESLYPSFF
jgi:hypothetical protein